MTKAPDLADQHKAGKLPADPRSNVVPMNAAARRAEEEKPRIHTVQDLLIDSMRRGLSSKEQRYACTTGIKELDRITGGMRPGHVWVFGADTNWGKSSFVVMVADENIRLGKRVLIVSNEDSPELYGDRLMCRRARVKALHLRDRTLDDDEKERISYETQRAEAVPVYLDARVNKRVKWVVAQVERLIVEENIDVVAFDYLQEFTSDQKYQDERVKFRDIASQLRTVVKKHNRTGMLLSQITVSESKKYPDKNSIRESRDVAHGAEAVMLGFTPAENLPRKNGQPIVRGTRCILADKVKDGPSKKVVPVDWDQDTASFVSQRMLAEGWRNENQGDEE